MSVGRRALFAALAAHATQARAQAQAEPRTLIFPRDHGAHPTFGIEWWYVTGWLRGHGARGDAPPPLGFQITFFRSRTGLARTLDSRFAARQLLFAHAALSDVGARRLVHAERLARWNEDPRATQAAATLDDTRVHIGPWHLARDAAGAYAARVADDAAGIDLALTFTPTQPLLLQGDGGFSRKGPLPTNASHYYSQVQLEVRGDMTRGERARGRSTRTAVLGRAWLDHEWSGSLMPEGAVGWDWIGINLDDGGALTAFRLRDARGSAVWSGGSFRSASGVARTFADGEATFDPLQTWTSPATRAAYGVRWRVRCPAGTFEVRALFDAQELDGRGTTGTVYWEGLSALHREGDGVRVGWGYLEMTGYAGALRL